MIDFLILLAYALNRLFRSRARLEAEILVLRHQLNILQRKSAKRAAFKSIDRLVFAVLYRLFPGVLDALKILKPETVIRWHRAGFRAYWRWKSRPRGGRPKIAREIRQLIGDISIANPLWGAPRIHGELLKLGIDVGQTTVAKYMARRRRPPSQGWKTFLRNHADGIASMDLFVVPTISFRLLYGFLILRHSRREILWLGVSAHPSAQWIARQVSEACGWQQAPQYVVAIGIVSMARSSFAAFERWAFGIGRFHHDHHGRTDTRRGSSVRSVGIALTMSLCSASGTFATCLDCTKDITMTLARTYR
jgi:hypothetical protein